MNRFILHLAFALVVSQACAEPVLLSPIELSSILKAQHNIFIIDVRPSSDYINSHIPGAVNISYLEILLSNIPKDKQILLYCSNEQCPLSRLAAKKLELAGYKNISVLDGGFAAWSVKGLAIETPAGINQNTPSVKIDSISASELSKRLADKNTRIVDLRPAKDFIIAHIKGAKNIPLESLEANLSALPIEAAYIIYDAQNIRVKTAAQLLSSKNYKVTRLEGGIQVWAAKKYIMESGQ